MDDQSGRHITHLLVEWKTGNREALDLLMPLVYQELRKLADHYLRNERTDHTLQPTALIHEAYLRLADQRLPEWRNRAHFFGVAAQIMRQVLVDAARRHRAVKRGSGQKTSLETSVEVSVSRAPDLVALDDALMELARFDERKVRVIELKYFGGLKIEETAEALGISEATVSRDLRAAEAWLRKYLAENAERGGGAETGVL
jgi:RNA polymerase sigma factor (TIGR02999 family)